MSKDINVLDDVFKVIWERIRAATDLIGQLREERRMLTDQLREVEQSYADRLKAFEKEIIILRSDLMTRDQELKRLRAQHTQLLNVNGHHSFSEEEREILKSRIRDLVTKINSYL